MFKNLFGGNKEDKQLKAKMENVALALANKDYKAVISEGESILEQVSDNKKPNIISMLALAYFHTKDYDMAIPHFLKMSEVENKNPDYLYNLCTAHVLNKQPEQGLEYLEKAIVLYQEKGKKENIPVSFMIFYAISALVETEEFNHAFDLMDRLAKIYKDISITDSQFLYSRGFVPFHTFMEKIKDTLIGQDKVDAIEWLTDFAEPLDEDGQAQVEELIEDLKSEQETEAVD